MTHVKTIPVMVMWSPTVAPAWLDQAPEILPCPHCGSTHVAVDRTYMPCVSPGRGPSYWIECLRCHAIGPNSPASGDPVSRKGSRSDQEYKCVCRAIKRWNKRVRKSPRKG